MKQFPSNYCEELEPDDGDEQTPLGSLQKGSVEMTLGASVELIRNTAGDSVPFIVKIFAGNTGSGGTGNNSSSSLPSIILGVKSEAEAKEWLEAIRGW